MRKPNVQQPFASMAMAWELSELLLFETKFYLYL